MVIIFHNIQENSLKKSFLFFFEKAYNTYVSANFRIQIPIFTPLKTEGKLWQKF